MSVDSINLSRSGPSCIPVVLDKAAELKKIMDNYHIVFQTPGVALEDIDVFLIGEKHKFLECKTVNGESISRIAGPNKISVFVECFPSWESRESSKEFHRQWLCIDESCCVSFYGWDASSEVLNSIGLDIDSAKRVLERLHSIDQRIFKVKLIQLDCEKIGLAWKREWLDYDNDQRFLNLKLYQDHLKLYQEALRAQQDELKVLFEEKSRFQHMLDRGLLTDEDRIRTFPDRTEAMVATLQKLRSERSPGEKVFFVAGAAHLVDTSHIQGPEHNIESLYEELAHHKAIILIPKIIC